MKQVEVELEYDILVSKFELQSGYYVHFRTNTFGKGMDLSNLHSYIFLNGREVQKILENSNPWLTCSLNKRRWTSVNLLVSGNILDREITCLVFPTTWFCPAQNKLCVWSRSRDMVTYINSTPSLAHSLILRSLSSRHIAQDTWHGCQYSLRLRGLSLFSLSRSAFRLDVFRSHVCTRPQTFRHIPIETNNQCGRTHGPQKHIAYSWVLVLGILSQPTQIVAQDTF